eukprot:PhM_4_TR5642/c0_g2_i1/m.90243/K08815/TTBK; tau tubulin kinase
MADVVDQEQVAINVNGGNNNGAVGEAPVAAASKPPAATPTKPAQPSAFLVRGEVVRERYQVMEKIGQGAFGEIYAGIDTKPPGEDVAIKCEQIDSKKMVLRLEVMALKHLQSCPHVVRYITSGRHQNTINYLVMERLGKNIADVRKESPQGEFDFVTSIKLTMNMLQAIEGVHGLGYLHRDIKPSNFVLGKGDSSERCYLIDFGLARKFRTESGEIRPPREKAGFRGTTRYASISSHKGKELGRVDDLWSLFYLLVEFVLRELPWRRKKEKDDIMVIKEAYAATLVNGLPEEFRLFQEHLAALAYEDAPNYSYLYGLMQSLLKKRPLSLAIDLDLVANAQLGRMDSARGAGTSQLSARGQRKSQKYRTEVISNRQGGAEWAPGDSANDEDVAALGETPMTKPNNIHVGGGGPSNNNGVVNGGGASTNQTPRLSAGLGSAQNLHGGNHGADTAPAAHGAAATVLDATAGHTNNVSGGGGGAVANTGHGGGNGGVVARTERNNNGCKCVVM